MIPAFLRTMESKQRIAANTVRAAVVSVTTFLKSSNRRKLVASATPPLTCMTASLVETSGCRVASQNISPVQRTAATEKKVTIRFIQNSHVWRAVPGKRPCGAGIRARVNCGVIRWTPRSRNSRGSPFPMPARLADGLDQGSDLKNHCWPSAPRPVRCRKREFGSPAPTRRKAGRLRLQCVLDRHDARVADRWNANKLRMAGKALRKC